MIKSLTRWFQSLFATKKPTALEVMKESMYRAEMTYLATLDAKEYHACRAEMLKVEARHDFERCKRLQQFIKVEDRSQCEMSGSGIDERTLEVLLGAVAADLNEFFPKREEAKQAAPGADINKQEPEPKA